MLDRKSIAVTAVSASAHETPTQFVLLLAEGPRRKGRERAPREAHDKIRLCVAVSMISAVGASWRPTSGVAAAAGSAVSCNAPVGQVLIEHDR